MWAEYRETAGDNHISRAPLPSVGLKRRGLGGEDLLSGAEASRKGYSQIIMTPQAGITGHKCPEMIPFSPSDWLVLPMGQTQL